MEALLIGLAVTCLSIGLLVVLLNRKPKTVTPLPNIPKTVTPLPNIPKTVTPLPNIPAPVVTPTHGCAQGLMTGPHAPAESMGVCQDGEGQVCMEGFVQNRHTDCFAVTDEASCNMYCTWFNNECVPYGPTCSPSGCAFGTDYLTEDRTLAVCNQGAVGQDVCLDGFVQVSHDAECTGKSQEDCTGLCGMYRGHCTALGWTCKPASELACNAASGPATACTSVGDCKPKESCCGLAATGASGNAFTQCAGDRVVCPVGASGQGKCMILP